MFEAYSGKSLIIQSFTPASGGCINNGGRVSIGGKDYFVKWNDARKYPRMFETEAQGLNLLRAAETLRIPLVIGHDVEGDSSFLILEYLEPAPMTEGYWRTLGRGLAAMHRQTRQSFGLDHDNYIGSLPQSNTSHESWTDFFINERVIPMLKTGLDAGQITPEISGRFENLFLKFEGLFPKEKPALIHGDLWNGNLIAGPAGEPCLIDPAVHYGHREADLAMTELFGGFSNQFYEAYEDAWPLMPGYRERKDLYNIYPLLVHVNLFGGGYLQQVVAILKRFGC